MKNAWLPVLIICVFVLSATAYAREEPIRIAAAASLTQAVKACISAFKEAHPDTEVLPHFASSGALARQLTSGAPADIYISANPKWMAYLQENNHVVPHTTVTLVQNILVFAGLPAAGVKGIDNLSSLKRIALCNPASAPAGRYAGHALRAKGVYTRLQREKHLIFAKDVRQALLYADRGEVDGAFIYRTDALLAQHAKILFQVDPVLHPRIEYPAAMTLRGVDNPAALEFFAFLAQEPAQAIFSHYGFIVPDAPAI